MPQAETISQTIKVFAYILFVFTSFVLAVVIPIQYNNTKMESYIVEFEAANNNYTSLINNNSLTDSEKLNLANDISDKNQVLAKKQANIIRFWNFDISRTNKEALLKLEPIKFSS